MSYNLSKEVFINTLNTSREKLKQFQNKEKWGWFTKQQMKDKLKWSKPKPQFPVELILLGSLSTKELQTHPPPLLSQGVHPDGGSFLQAGW